MMAGHDSGLTTEIIVQRGAPPSGDDLDHAVHSLSKGSSEAKALAANALANSAINARAKDAIAAAGGIPPLVGLLATGCAVETAARALGNLASTSESNRQAIGAAGGVEPLVALLMHGTEVQRCAAATAIAHLALDPDNKRHAIESGAIPPLQRMSSSMGTRAQVDRAARALRILEARDECVVSAGLTRPAAAASRAAELGPGTPIGSAVQPGAGSTGGVLGMRMDDAVLGHIPSSKGLLLTSPSGSGSSPDSIFFSPSQRPDGRP